MGKELEDILVGKQHIVILTHMAPDGDAMGSALAMYHYVMDRFAVGQVSVIVPNAFPAFYSWMPGAEQIKIYEKEPDACSALIAAADLFICTDFNDPKRINPAGDKMMANPAPKILIDHHLKGTMDAFGVIEIRADEQVCRGDEGTACVRFFLINLDLLRTRHP